MTSRLEKTTSKPVHLSSKPPSPAQIIATAAASPRNAAETTPKKFEKHARRTWRRSASLRPKNGAPKGFAAGPLPPIVTTTIQVPIPIDIVDMNQATHDDEVKECRSPSTLSTTSSSGVDSNGTTETNETVPHSHPDSGLGDDCPKLSDSDDVESTHSFSSNFGRPPPPQASFFPQPFGLPGFPDILPPIATEEELENIRQFRRQHIYYKNFFARQRRLQQNGPAFIPTHPHPQVPYIFIPYETIDNFLLYLESLYPQLSRSRSTTMQSSDESCCSTTATIQSRAEAAEASMPLRHDPRLEASFAPLRFVPPMNGAAQPVGPCSTTTQSSRKTSIDSTHTSEDGHPLSYVPHMPSYSSMPVLAQQASRNDLDYSRIYLDQFNVNPHFERRHPFAPPHLQQRHRHYQHFPSGIHRTATALSAIPHFCARVVGCVCSERPTCERSVCLQVETLVGGPRVTGHRRSTQCNSAGLRHLIFEKMESIKKNTPRPRPSFVLCSVDRARLPRSGAFVRSTALWFRPARLGWRHNNQRPFLTYSSEKIFEAQLQRHQALATAPHPFADLCSGFDSDSADDEDEEEEPRSLSPSVSDRSIFTDDGQLTTVATDVDDHCSVVSSSFADGWVSSHEEGDEDDASSSDRSPKFFIPLLGDVEDASSEDSADVEAEKQHIDADLARLMINSSYNIPGFTLPMVAASSKSGSETTISACKSCPSVGGESGYLSCESVSPPPSSETTAPTESKAPPTPLPPPNDVFHDGQFQVSKMDVLSEQIWYFHKDITQTEATLHRKMTLRNHLYSVIKMAFPMSGLYIVGSSLNGFGNNSSDMDLCMMITNKDIDQRTDAVVILNHVMNCLSNSEIIRENGLKLIIAKVPILRIKFNAPYEDITVDLNANNAVAIKNTHLLSHYSTFDWRLCPLVSVIKEWAKRRGMNDANKSSFTSYSLVLMVIHYLQCGLDKPTLPSLQKMYPKRFSEKNDVRTLKMQIEKPFEFPSADEWDYDYSASLCDLLLGFLRYYAYEFDFNHDAISVRLGQRTDRAFVAKNSSPFNTLSQWRCICIEEPFTLSNTAHSIYDEVIFEAIKGAFRSGHEELDMNRDLDAFLNMPPIKIPLANTRGQHYGNFAVETNFTPTDPEPPVLVGNENGVESSENDVVDRKLVEDVLDSLKAAEEENFPAISASEDAPQKRSAKKNRKGARGGK
ncbi:hypothetical protein QR680_008786 [Steinernema hermaphroditum]|uniref:PAP-associated domain-containing protein n=1 Tax=Steinernema hermaphroditum TaxID=289476 RepID=A0AA39IKD0_9BILA|nr:hypothetical protein QR680_008786 [Steinernema hermaphroditum]